jgi:hypothetical protein
VVVGDEDFNHDFAGLESTSLRKSGGDFLPALQIYKNPWRLRSNLRFRKSGSDWKSPPDFQMATTAGESALRVFAPERCNAISGRDTPNENAGCPKLGAGIFFCPKTKV